MRGKNKIKICGWKLKGSQLQWLIEKNQENMRLRFSFCSSCLESKDWTILLVRIRFSTSQNRQRLWWPLISCILNHTVVIIFLVLMSRCPDIHIDVQISSMIEVEVYFACCWISFNPCPQLYPLILGPITILGPLIQNMGTLVGKGDGEKKRKEGKFWLINWLSKILVLCWTCWHWIEI